MRAYDEAKSPVRPWETRGGEARRRTTGERDVREAARGWVSIPITHKFAPIGSRPHHDRRRGHTDRITIALRRHHGGDCRAALRESGGGRYTHQGRDGLQPSSLVAPPGRAVVAAFGACRLERLGRVVDASRRGAHPARA